MAVTLREFVTKWGFQVDDAELKKLDKSFAETRRGMQKLSANMNRIGKDLSLKLTLPIVGFGAYAVKAASDAEETFSKFGVVFKDVAEESEIVADNFRKNFGLSGVAAKQLLSDTGDLLSGFGFAGDMSLDLSKKVNELAVDLASFTNFSGGAEGASKALTKALLGERESVKSLGISILEEDVKKQVALQRTQGLTFETERQAKAYATLTLAQKQSKNAIGDFARTSDSFANQWRIMRARLTDAAVAFGKILLPPALKVVQAVAGMLEYLQGLSDTTRTIIIVIAGLAAALGPLLIIFGSVLNAILAIRTAMVLFGNQALIANAKFIALPLAIGAAVVAIGLVIEDLIGFFQGKNSATGVILQSVDDMVNAFMTKFPVIGDIVRRVIVGITTPIRAVVALVRGLSGALAGLIAGDMGTVKDALLDAGQSFLKPMQSIAMGEEFSSADALGIGGIGRPVKGGGNQSSVNQSINAPINISVPEGTAPEAVGPQVRKGIEEGLGNLLRETSRQTSTAVQN